ncbi:MAG: HEAT repeat domain-containing protein [Deltaproteobacteria bacterium]|jgi:HEAT repeat protein|nr:HEAT repeat domain-containing protein [Deltaproteobacteria bacterium]
MSVVVFDPKERIAALVRAYLLDLNRFAREKKEAVALFLRALRILDISVCREIFFVLGAFVKEETAIPIYELMQESDASDEIKDYAAVHLSVIGPFLNHPQQLLSRLLSDVAHGDHERRIRAILAIGWEGNLVAALPLIECIYDDNQEIQEIAIAALCNLHEKRVVRLLMDRLATCSKEVKKVILLNLWRFQETSPEIVALYLKELQFGDEDIKPGLMALLKQFEMPGYENEFRGLLSHEDQEIRATAVEVLARQGRLDAQELRCLANDPAMPVKRAAIKALHASTAR